MTQTNPKIWFAVDEDGTEWWYEHEPSRSTRGHEWYSDTEYDRLFTGAIAAITGVTLTWESEPLEWVVGERKEAENIRELMEALDSLVQLKDWKDRHGKDEHYEKHQPAAWDNARIVLSKLKHE